MKKLNLQGFILIGVVILAAFSRLYTQGFNVSPLAALALFGGAHFYSRLQAFLIPVAAIWLSDLYVNNVVYAHMNEGFVWFYSGFYWQYGSYLLIAAMGMYLFRSHVSVKRVVAGALCSGLLFFLVSNFGTWLTGGMYPRTLEGLAACMMAGLPFYKGTVFGDLFFSALLFGGYYYLQKYYVVFRQPHLKYHQ